MIPHFRLVRFLKRIMIASQLSSYDIDIIAQFIDVLWDYCYITLDERDLLIAFQETLSKEKHNA